MDAGVVFPLARILAARLDEGHTLAVRCRMIISDLLRVPDMQVRGFVCVFYSPVTCHMVP